MEQQLEQITVSDDTKKTTRKYTAGDFEGPLDLLWALIRDNKINIYDSKDYKRLQILEGHKENVISIIRLVDGRIASCSNDKTIKIWKW